jgi:transmembrane sensor
MQRKPPTQVNEQIYQEACEWFVEFRSGELDAAARRRFDAWARKSPEHLAAYLEIAALWKEGLVLHSPLDTETLVTEAAADESTVVELPQRPLEHRGRRSWTLRGGRFWLAASIAGLALMGGTLIAYRHLRAPIYATTFGEQRSITLADGSIVDINSHSKIRVRYLTHERDVDLLEGQALFHVAKDPARPFIVRSAATQVRAVGTEFDVYRKVDVYRRVEDTVVTVVEGRVAVQLPPGAAKTPLFLSAGEQVLVTPQAMQKAEHPSVAMATSWTRRQIQFESASLADVAEEFNRYNERQLVIEDPTLYDFHITGVFSSSDPASLVRFLRERPGVQVTETAAEIRVSRKIL